ncbi:hypothetical protein GVAV_003425 [Gurleya vavrai]
MHLCLLDNVYVESPSDKYMNVRSEVSIFAPKDYKNMRKLQSEILKNYTYTYIPSTKEFKLLPFDTGDDQLLEIIPYDYKNCFRITKNDKCFTYNLQTKKIYLEDCRKNDSEQLFDFECIDCPSQYDIYDMTIRGEEAELKALERKTGRLDLAAYKKIQDIAKIMQNVSKCFTVNGTCDENAIEDIPMSCFDTFGRAHHIDDDKLYNDYKHHEYEIATGKRNAHFYDMIHKNYLLPQNLYEFESLEQSSRGSKFSEEYSTSTKQSIDHFYENVKNCIAKNGDLEMCRISAFEETLNNLNSSDRESFSNFYDKMPTGTANDPYNWLADLKNKKDAAEQRALEAKTEEEKKNYIKEKLNSAKDYVKKKYNEAVDGTKMAFEKNSNFMSDIKDKAVAAKADLEDKISKKLENAIKS